MVSWVGWCALNVWLWCSGKDDEAWDKSVVVLWEFTSAWSGWMTIEMDRYRTHSLAEVGTLWSEGVSDVRLMVVWKTECMMYWRKEFWAGHEVVLWLGWTGLCVDTIIVSHFCWLWVVAGIAIGAGWYEIGWGILTEYGVVCGIKLGSWLSEGYIYRMGSVGKLTGGSPCCLSDTLIGCISCCWLVRQLGELDVFLLDCIEIVTLVWHCVTS